MRRWGMIALLIGLMPVMTMPGVASATQIYNAPASSPNSPSPSSSGTTPDLPELREKEAPAIAPPATIQEAANRYYGECLKKQHPLLDAENQKLLCGCTASKIPGVMSLEQMSVMTQNNDAGAEQRARMTLFVYTPCIEYPTRAMVLSSCMNNPGVKGTLANPQGVCGCLADKMADFMRGAAPGAMKGALMRNRNDFDPLSALMGSDGFQAEQDLALSNCMQQAQLRR
jgi:hypothetical protein